MQSDIRFAENVDKRTVTQFDSNSFSAMLCINNALCLLPLAYNWPVISGLSCWSWRVVWYFWSGMWCCGFQCRQPEHPVWKRHRVNSVWLFYTCGTLLPYALSISCTCCLFHPLLPHTTVGNRCLRVPVHVYISVCRIKLQKNEGYENNCTRKQDLR